MTAADKPTPPAEQALILASPAREATAATRLLGLTLAERQVANLRSQGVERIAVYGPQHAIPAPRREGLRFVEASDELSAIRAELQQAAKQQRALWVLPADVLYHPKLLAEIRGQASATSSATTAYGEDNGHLVLRLEATALLGALPELPAGGDLAALVARLEADADLLQLSPPEGFFATPVTEPGDRKRAVASMLKTNWRPHDGIIARVLNKHISVRISRVIANGPITPNQMTFWAFVLALIGIGFAAWGTYLSLLIGAGLLQIQSILDGCDGELARLRYQSSAWGAWFDTIVDDVIGVLWVAALGLGCYRAFGHWAYLAAGVSAAICYTISTGTVFYILWRHGAKSHSEFTWWFEEGTDPEADYPDLKLVSTWLKFVVRRDFYVLFFLLMAAVGQIRVALLFAMLGAYGWFIAAMIQFSKRGLRVVPKG